ncbi:MAG TPA: hypothetical protein VLC98_14855 [Phnomibacter sp.]|nr:hypothetical protein [Phnomibacter sp.]
MNNNEQMDKWVDEALNSFDGASRATANPFLFTRIQERLRQKNSPWEKVANFIARPAFVIGMVVVFVAANFYVATKENADKLAKEQQKNEQLFASEYNTNSSLNNELNPNR